MKIECQLDKIKQAIVLTERATGKNLTLPVLNSILFIVKNKKLILKATNLNIGIEITVPAKIEEEGVVVVRSDVLLSIITSIQNESSVFFETKNENLLIKTKNSNFLIKSTTTDDFPTIPIVKGNVFSLNSRVFIDGLKSVFYSSSVSEIKPEIGSVFVYQDDGNIVFVATDSFRLAEKKIKNKNKAVFDGFLIPFKNVVEMIKIFDSTNEELEITTQNNLISIKNEYIYLTSRIIDGNFPDYKQIIPKNPNTKIVVLKQDLLNTLKLSNIFSDKFNQIELKINPNQHLFTIESKNSDIGESINKIPCTISGEEVVANFNYKYIIDCFQSINTDSLSIELTNNNKPMILTPIGDPSFIYLIMPMNK